MSGPVVVPTRLWRVAGTLAIAHIVLVFAGVAFERSPELGASAHTTETALVHSSLLMVFAGGYVEYLGFLVFLAAALLLSRLLRDTGATAGWLSACIAGAAVTFTAITFATGMAAGAAAVYDGHRGVSLDVVTTVNDVRIFAFYLSTGVLGFFTLAVAAAVRATGVLPRWVSWTGFVVGVLAVAAPALQAWDAVNTVSMLWFAWFLALGILGLRGPRGAVPAAGEPVTARV
jgi:hypothetical protein